MTNRINQDYVDRWLEQRRRPRVVVQQNNSLALRLITISTIYDDPTDSDEWILIKRKANFFNRPKKYLPAPRILERVRQAFGWPTCNTLVRRYFPRYPHVTWWEKAYTRMINTARYYTWGYLERCLETVKEHALELLRNPVSSSFLARRGKPKRQRSGRPSPRPVERIDVDRYQHLVHR